MELELELELELALALPAGAEMVDKDKTVLVHTTFYALHVIY